MKLTRQILQRAQGGDHKAIETIMDEYIETIEAECAKFGIWKYPEISHSDLQQFVVYKVLGRLDRFQDSGEDDLDQRFKKWLQKTTRNIVSNFLRDRQAKVRSPEQGHQQFDESTQQYFRDRRLTKTPSSILVAEEEAKKIQDIMSQCLDSEAQSILNLRVVEGLSLKDIAERLALSYDQVRYKYDKSLTIIAKRLN